MQHRFTLTAGLAALGVATVSLSSLGCGDGGYQCGPGTMAVSGVCLPDEPDARRPPTPDAATDMSPVDPDMGVIPPPPPPPDMGPPPDPDMGLPPPVDMGPPPPMDMGPPPPVDMGPPPDPDLGPADTGPMVDMSIFDPDLGPMDEDMGPMDAGPMDAGPMDMGPVDMGPIMDSGPAVPGPARLLFSRVVVGGDTREAIEIYNPNAFAVDLSNVFISDYSRYGEIPAGIRPPAGMPNSDFAIRFPAGASIGAHRYVLVSLRTVVAFSGAIAGVRVDFEMRGAPGGARTMRDYGNVGDGLLTNNTEGVVLFYWDDAADLVIDLDYVRWESPTDAGASTPDPIFNKTSLAVDGPDPGTTTSTYGSDVGSTSIVAPGYNVLDSMRNHHLVRCDYNETGEARRADANGVSSGGMRDDEMSEPIGTTWHVVQDMAYSFDSTPPGSACPGGVVGI